MGDKIPGHFTMRLGTRLTKLVTAEAFSKSMDKVDIMKEELNDRYSKMNDGQINKLLSLYDRMTPAERKRPSKS